METDGLAAELIRRVGELRREVMRGKLTFAPSGELFVLSLIIMDEPKTPGEIRDALGVSSARVAFCLRALECKGLILRETDARDRRKIRVTATERGRERFAERREALRGTVERLLRELGEEDAREFVRITGRMIGILQDLKTEQ
ncbi:MAG: winged helix DNA-binding protein [Oscillospiraceae bacterium]|jgi:DNA-binding MarR family transcriptional regulator|nr:winged helix DNA-binding protein [Oscillospiraceae bacterium]